MTILISLLAYHQIRHQATCKVDSSLVIAYGHVNLPQGLCGYNMYRLSYSLYHPEGRCQTQNTKKCESETGYETIGLIKITAEYV